MQLKYSVAFDSHLVELSSEEDAEKLTRKIAESFSKNSKEIEHINTKEELKALHEGIEDGTEPEKKEEKTELHEQK